MWTVILIADISNYRPSHQQTSLKSELLEMDSYEKLNEKISIY